MAKRPPTFIERAREAGLMRKPQPVRSQDKESMAAQRPRKSRRWRALRLSVLRRKPLCVNCLAMDRTTLAEEVDHIIPIRIRPDLAFVRRNLQPLCKPCHSRKTMMERRRRE